jgi:hypothetical protein
MADPQTPPPAARWLVICITPDFCKTSGTDVPYFIVSEAKLADLQSVNVGFNGLRSLNYKSITRSCTGHEAGESGSKSGLPVSGPCEPLDENDTVRINGEGAVRESDRFWMNHQNCIGRVFAVPAVSSPGDGNNLADAEFDRAVAELISSTISQCGGDLGAAKSALTGLRQTAKDSIVSENPVVVAAQHFLNYAADDTQSPKVKIGTIYVTEWPKKLGLEKVADFVKQIPYVAELWGVERNKPSSKWDERVYRWSFAGVLAGAKRRGGVAWGPLEVKNKSDTNRGFHPPTQNPKKTPSHTPTASTAPEPTPTPTPAPAPTPTPKV